MLNATPTTAVKPESPRRNYGFQWKPILVLVQQKPGTANLTELLHEHLRKSKENRLHHGRNRLSASGENVAMPQSPRELLMNGGPDAPHALVDLPRKVPTRRRAQSLTPVSSIPSTLPPLLRSRRSISDGSTIGPPAPKPLSTAPGALLISAWIVGGVFFGILILFLIRLRQRRRKSALPISLSNTEVCIERL